jgi:hypothetical protein
MHQPCDTLEKRAFTGTVRANDRGNLPSFDAQ